LRHDTSWGQRIQPEVEASDIVSSRVVFHARLDRRLEILARRPERFARDALRLCVAFDARGFDLEISDPNAWRGTTGSMRVPVEKQFSTEIESVRTLDREEELRLAIRIEFARIRLDHALEQHGLDSDDLAAGTALPPKVRRRRFEWHALRLEMVERNLYLVPIFVGRCSHKSSDRADLIQAAASALFRAVDGFDWRRGLLFRTYAVHWLHKGFRSHLYDFSATVRVPAYLQRAFKHINAAVERLGDPQASVERIALEADLRESTVELARAATRRTRSLDAPLDRFDGRRTLASELFQRKGENPYSTDLENRSIEWGVHAALGTLTDDERCVVELRFGLGDRPRHRYAELAEELGLRREHVRRILVRAMSKMRTPRVRKLLEPILA